MVRLFSKLLQITDVKNTKLANTDVSSVAAVEKAFRVNQKINANTVKHAAKRTREQVLSGLRKEI